MGIPCGVTSLRRTIIYIYIYIYITKWQGGAGRDTTGIKREIENVSCPTLNPYSTASRERTELKDKSAKRNLYGFTKHGACFSVERKQLEMQMGLGH